jgi:hypothetical protein
MQQIGFLFQNVLSAQHVSGTIMHTIRSSRIIQMVAACGTWVFDLPVVGLVCSSRFYVSGHIKPPLNIFRAQLCPSSGAQELYRWLLLVVHGCLVYRSLVWFGAVGFGHIKLKLHTRSTTPMYHKQQPFV